MRGTEEKQRMIVEELLDNEDHAQVESLKKTLKAQRQRRKKPLVDSAGDAASAMEDIGSVAQGQRSLPPLNTSVTKSLSTESSMRERLREKLKAGRSKAESILQQESPSVSPRSFPRSKAADTVTKYDDEQEVSSLQKVKDVEAQLISRVRFRDAVRTVQKKSHVPDGVPTADESYNFFTFSFDPDPETDEGKEKKKKKSESSKEEDVGEYSSRVEEEEAEEGMEEDKSLVPEDDLFLIEQTARDFIEVTAAEYEGYHNRLQKEKDLLFIPRLRQVPPSQKLPDNKQPRYLEDEGLYVGVRPEVSRTNQNILENRILQQDAGKKWFGDDGNVLALPNPIKTSTTRPPIFTLHEGLDPALETLHIKAIPSKKSSQYMVGSGGLLGDFQLDIDISGIVFTHHPLFSREHVLANKLSQLYDQYLGRKQKNLAKLLTDKLHALRNAVQDISAGGIHGSSTITEQSIHEYKLDIRQTRKCRDAEQEKDRTLLKSLIKVWKEIKSLREFQKFNNTPVKLYLRKEEVNRKADEESYEAEIQAEINELMEEYMEEYQKNLKQYRTDLKQWKAWKKTQKRKGKKKEGTEQDDEAEADYMVEELTKPSMPAQVDRHDIEVQVRDKAANIRRRPGEPILNPELSLSGYVTPDNMCPRGEILRREDVLKHSLFIKILFNNKEVSRTVTVRLGHDFRVHMGQIFNLQIFNWPESIKLQIHETAGYLGTTLLAEAFLPIPETTMLTGSAPVEEVEFSSNQRVMYDHEGVGSDVPFSFEADGSNKMALMTSGKVAYCVSWAVGENGVPLVPSMSQQKNALQQ